MLIPKLKTFLFLPLLSTYLSSIKPLGIDLKYHLLMYSGKEREALEEELWTQAPGLTFALPLWCPYLLDSLFAHLINQTVN